MHRCVDCDMPTQDPHALPGTGDRRVDLVCARCCVHCNSRREQR